MSLVRLGSIFGGNGFDLWDTFSIFRSAVAVGSEATAFANTRIECRETPEAFVFCADLPGVKKEEVKVEVEEDGNVLVIAGERSRERVERSDTLHQIERASGAFLGRFHLPESARVDQVRAALDANGVLTVTVPKEGVKKPEAKDIEFCA